MAGPGGSVLIRPAHRRRIDPRAGSAYIKAVGERVDVPWKTIPVSEPLLPGEFSAALRQQRGQPVYWTALITTIANVSTTAARLLVEQGAVTVNDEPVRGSFGYVKPGDVVRMGDGRDYVIGEAP
jgi:hypothetical protein